MVNDCWSGFGSELKSSEQGKLWSGDDMEEFRNIMDFEGEI